MAGRERKRPHPPEARPRPAGRGGVTAASALYVGHVVHRRLADFDHRLRYRTWMLLIDLDAIEAERPRLLSRRPFSLLSWRATDHGDGSATPLRLQIETALALAGIQIDGGPIRLLTMPRVLGYGFNPISVYFAHGPDGVLRGLVHEVTNTFGERHSYAMPAGLAPDGQARHATDKTHFVSPYMDQALTYEFEVHAPDDRVSVAILAKRAGRPLLTASFAGERRPLTDASLARLFVTHALLTFKVTAAIHWEALKMMLKGARYRHRPNAPDHPVTVGRA
ncbi:MAG: DUF1365 family protein [Caulobacteraceae bacterium]|nr:DUF1365 family protein [Caulobacteraceae bacterium]